MGKFYNRLVLKRCLAFVKFNGVLEKFRVFHGRSWRELLACLNSLSIDSFCLATYVWSSPVRCTTITATQSWIDASYGHIDRMKLLFFTVVRNRGWSIESFWDEITSNWEIGKNKNIYIEHNCACAIKNRRSIAGEKLQSDAVVILYTYNVKASKNQVDRHLPSSSSRRTNNIKRHQLAVVIAENYGSACAHVTTLARSTRSIYDIFGFEISNRNIFWWLLASSIWRALAIICNVNQ